MDARKPKTPPCPRHLSKCKGAVSIWQQVAGDYELEERHLRLLELACTQYARAEACRERLDKDGLTVADRWGQLKEHPLRAAEKQHSEAFRLLMRELGLDIESPSQLSDYRPPRIAPGA